MSLDPGTIGSFFVYGTLCRGQCREKCWPHPPIAVVPAWVFGTLYDREDYPALTSGHDRVQGELWTFRPDQMRDVLEVIDVVEGTNQPGTSNLYDRLIVDVYGIEVLTQTEITPKERIAQAWGYHYSTPPEQDGFIRVQPQAGQRVRWPCEDLRPET
ncbi:MAG: gamma-glutamylcyclotransferase [Rhodopirellula sp. JB053]